MQCTVSPMVSPDRVSDVCVCAGGCLCSSRVLCHVLDGAVVGSARSRRRHGAGLAACSGRCHGGRGMGRMFGVGGRAFCPRMWNGGVCRTPYDRRMWVNSDSCLLRQPALNRKVKTNAGKEKSWMAKLVSLSSWPRSPRHIVAPSLILCLPSSLTCLLCRASMALLRRCRAAIVMAARA